MKRKNSGISLLISLGISLLVLGIALSVVASINRSVQRSADLGRANQVFFAAESGFESAFFHHNARGQGVHFMTDDASQSITHSETSSLVSWTIEGRDNPFSGILKERQKIQVPFFWDDSTNPTKDPPIMGENFDPDHTNAGKLIGEFSLVFSDDDIPVDFDFGTADDAVLIDWSMSREHTFDGLQTFVPELGSGNDACGLGSEFICKGNFLTDGEATIDSTDTIPGEILPGRIITNLANFLGDSDTQKFTLSFFPLLSFEDTGGAKIPGIPFELTTDGVALPKESYEITANVSIGSFSKTITAVVPEKATIGAFDYVVFD